MGRVCGVVYCILVGIYPGFIKEDQYAREETIQF